jgi:hypothetical protein
MAKLTDSKEYKAFYKLLFTASEDENGSVANWSDLWDAMVREENFKLVTFA